MVRRRTVSVECWHGWSVDTTCRAPSKTFQCTRAVDYTTNDNDSAHVPVFNVHVTVLAHVVSVRRSLGRSVVVIGSS